MTLKYHIMRSDEVRLLRKNNNTVSYPDYINYVIVNILFSLYAVLSSSLLITSSGGIMER